tara:strand:+ start:19771 stop:19911 length:141 start_codon:yes stop_codon:yes gene_type:complete
MLVGVVPDVTGGQASVMAWGFGFGLMGVFGLLGFACLLLLDRQACG